MNSAVEKFLDFPFQLVAPAKDESSLNWISISKYTTAQAPSFKERACTEILIPINRESRSAAYVERGEVEEEAPQPRRIPGVLGKHRLEVAFAGSMRG